MGVGALPLTWILVVYRKLMVCVNYAVKQWRINCFQIKYLVSGRTKGALIPEATVVASSSRAIAVVLDAWLRLTLNQHTRNIKEVKK